MPFRDRSRHVTTRRGEMSSTTPPTSEAYRQATGASHDDHSDESRFEFGPEVVEQTVADAPELDRTALDKLSTDQRALLTELLEGFDSRADVLRWMAALTIQTLGVLDDAWYRSRATDSPTMSYLLGEPWGLVERDVDAATAREVRRGMAALDLLPATQRAHHAFRWTATDWYDGDKRDTPDAEKLRDPAMRPELGRLEEHMTWSVDRLLEGFDSREAFLSWGQRVVQASYAELEAEVVRDAYFEEPVIDAMTGDTNRDAFTRETWCAVYLLPAFNRAASSTSSHASEVPREAREQKSIPMG